LPLENLRYRMLDDLLEILFRHALKNRSQPEFLPAPLAPKKHCPKC